MAAPKRTGLGRGIGALIPSFDQSSKTPVDIFFPALIDGSSTSSSPAPSDVIFGGDQPISARNSDLQSVPGARLAQINPEDILPNESQPRSVFDPDELAELVHSVREFGVLQPVVVRPHPSISGKYELVMGERRLRATKIAGLSYIPAVVKDTANEDMLRDALLENLHRSQLNPLEEASAYQQLLSDFGITQDQLATRLGRSRPQISNTMRLLKLPESVQMKVAAGVLSAGHARAILSVGDDHELMTKIADRIINEDLSVRAAETIAGEPQSPKHASVRNGSRQDFLQDLASRLGDQLNTRVKISIGVKKGQITIDFGSVSDLRRILNELGQEVPDL